VASFIIIYAWPRSDGDLAGEGYITVAVVKFWKTIVNCDIEMMVEV